MLINYFYIVLSAFGLYTWALYFSIQGPIMTFIVYVTFILSAVYINISFVIQIEYFKSINYSWLDYMGLDSFNTHSDLFEERKSQLCF